MIKNAITKAIAHFDFTSPQDIAKQGGTINGSTSFDRAKGMYFDGSTNYIEYKIPNTLLAQPEISFVVEFTPDFNWDDGYAYYLFDTGTRYFIRKLKAGDGNSLTFYMGGTNIGGISGIVYGPFWKQNERNQIVLSGVSGDTKVYLNGIYLSTFTTAWSPAYVSNLYVGATASYTYKFKGHLHSMVLYNTALTEQEAKDLYTRSTFSYHKEADIWLDMAEVSDGKVLDKSGKGNHFTVNGATFQNPGMEFDGIDDYLYANGQFFSTEEQSIVACFRPVFDVADNVNHYLWSSGSTTRNELIKSNFNKLSILLGGVVIYEIPLTDWQSVWRHNGVNVVAITSVSGDTSAYLNGVTILNGYSTPWSPIAVNYAALGVSRSSSNDFFEGTIYHFSTYPKKLTPVQVRDITSYLMNKYH